MRSVHPWYRRALSAVGDLFVDEAPPAKDDLIRLDGWENAVTGLGTYARDKSTHAEFTRCDSITLNWELLEAIYHDDDISGRFIDIFPNHMFRKGWDIHVEDDTLGEQSRDFVKYAKKLRLTDKFKEAERWGRLYGGALLQLGIDDNRPVDQPVDEKNIRAITYATVIERQYVMPDTYYSDPMSDRFGEPETYIVTNNMVSSPGSAGSIVGSMVYRIHESRVIRFEGAPTSRRERQRLGGWTHSVLQRPYEKIKAFVQVFQASSNLMTDASQGVYKLEGLMSQIGSNEKSALETRMLMLDMGRSVARSILLDKDGEEFERTIAAISGYPDMLDRFMMLLSSAFEVPVTVLMGRSAAGMNSTGDSDFRQLYDVVESKQTNELEPKLQRAHRYIALAKDGPTGGEEVDLEFKFRSLWSPTLMERSQINFTQSQADLNYVTMGAVTGEEIALSRFGEDGELRLTTHIDTQGRRDAQEAAKTFDPYESAGPDEQGGEMDLKRQGAPPAPKVPLGPDGKPVQKPTTGAGNAPNNGRAGKVTRPNSSQPGYKSGSGR